MSGIFGEYQRIYAEHNIPIFPVTLTPDVKKPAVSNYLRMGLVASSQLATRREFADHDAFGFAVGPRSRVTIADIDTPDENVVADAIASLGPSPLIVRTASKGFHLYYAHQGEPRKAANGRLWADKPIDLLGRNGFVVAPPSKGPRGGYEIVHGSLDELGRLLPINTGALPLHSPVSSVLRPESIVYGTIPKPWSEMRERDGRNPALWTRLMQEEKEVRTFTELLHRGNLLNTHFAQPMDGSEVASIVASVWQYRISGRNCHGRPGVVLRAADFMREQALLGCSDAVHLLIFLRVNNKPDSQFWIANGLRHTFGWGLDRIQSARRRLIECGYIQQVRSPRQGHPAEYRFNPRVGEIG